MEDSWSADIKSALKKESRWKASIFIKSSNAKLINQITRISYPDNIGNSHVNIVDLLEPDKGYMLQNILPNLTVKNALFEFEGFNLLNDARDITDYIKQSAFERGTILNIANTHKKSNSNKHHTITLTCAHYGKPSRDIMKSKEYNNGCIQANNTIIQQSHYGPSFKNNSRNSSFQRVNNTDISKKTNRSNTKKCVCNFQLTIMFDDITSKWFLRGRKKQCVDVCYHTNHVYIDPKHMSCPKHIMDKNVNDTIMTGIDAGIQTTNIILYVHEKHGKNIDYQTIHSMKMSKINKLIEECGLNPGGSSVDQLIKIFTSMENVSFLYIIHRYNSGFVTCRKNRGETMQEKINNVLGTDEEDEYFHKSVRNWRDALQLKSTNNVLVAFAWAHDDEVKNTEMYPEFLAADVTFGVNRERRDLLLVAGIDGRHRIFTSFRCFIPSKQEQTYTWIFKVAMPHLLSKQALKYNLCISTDNEDGLNNAINSSILSSNESFKFSKLRLDCYHFHTKTWRKNIIATCKDTLNAKLALEIMNSWIMTWFKRIETKEELDVSLQHLMSYFNSKTKCIGDTCTDAVNKHVCHIITHQDKLLHPYWKDVCTFDFIGDSIVESANNPIKHSALGVSSAMDISTSGHTQVKATEAKILKETISSAKKVNSIKIWSNSLTKDFLTDYAEGLACHNFDRKIHYTKRCVSFNKWLVVDSNLFNDNYHQEVNPDSFIDPIKFMRVREVTITDDSFMNCTCSYHLRYLMPCVHMCCVIEDKNNYVPELFHIRWWKHFHYFYKNNVNDSNKSTVENTELALENIRSNHFSKIDGKYKGVPLYGTPFGEQIISKNGFVSTILNDNVTCAMKAIVKMHNERKPLIYGKPWYKNYMSLDVSMLSKPNDSKEHQNDSSYSFENVENYSQDIESLGNMGAGSQAMSQLSDFRQNIEASQKSSSDLSECRDYLQSSKTSESLNVYSDLNPMFSSLLATIKTKDQLQEAQDMMEKLTFKFTNELNKKRNIGTNETLFIGELNGQRRPEKRYKEFYEEI